MSDRPPRVSEIVNLLPQRLQLRFNSLSSYVQVLIDDVRSEVGVSRNLTADETQFIQLAVFVYSLDSFFRAGTRSARSAAVTFEDLGLQGFQVGTASFTRNNRNTRRGELLADSLRAAVAGTSLFTVVRSSRSIRELVTRMIREISEHA